MTVLPPLVVKVFDCDRFPPADEALDCAPADGAARLIDGLRAAAELRLAGAVAAGLAPWAFAAGAAALAPPPLLAPPPPPPRPPPPRARVSRAEQTVIAATATAT
ncbi:MAG TPA: hypothetical protein VGX78_06195 [Pirellulales bacterium]|nr:hypothetical protein [Pirellulales bacterium]